MPKLSVGGNPRRSWQPVALDAANTVAITESLHTAFAVAREAGETKLANEVAAIHARMNQRIRAIAVRSAEIFEEEAKAQLNATQVRPDSERGGTKLVDLIKGEAWDPTADFASGWVSMGILDELNKAINPYAKTAKGQRPYWPAQEYGYEYSHVPEGFFVGVGGRGLFRPSGAQFRLHPMFAVMTAGRRFAVDSSGSAGVQLTGGSRFQAPPTIEARKFLAHGRDMAVAYWQREMRKLDGEVGRQLKGVLAQIVARGSAASRRRGR